LERPVGVRSAGRWAAEAQDVTAEEDSPIRAAWTGRDLEVIVFVLVFA